MNEHHIRIPALVFPSQKKAYLPLSSAFRPYQRPTKWNQQKNCKLGDTHGYEHRQYNDSHKKHGVDTVTLQRAKEIVVTQA